MRARGCLPNHFRLNCIDPLIRRSFKSPGSNKDEKETRKLLLKKMLSVGKRPKSDRKSGKTKTRKSAKRAGDKSGKKKTRGRRKGSKDSLNTKQTDIELEEPIGAKRRTLKESRTHVHFFKVIYSCQVSIIYSQNVSAFLVL